MAIIQFLGAINAQGPPAGICINRPLFFFVRDVTACNAFFRCEQGGSFSPGTCANDWMFSQEQQRCLLPQQANCFQCPSDPIIDLTFEGSCNQFVRCITGQPQHLECGPGLQFDQNLQSCNHENLVNCDNAAPPPVQCPAVDDPLNRVFVRDANDCAVYFVCVQGTPHRRTCPPSLGFNLVTNICDLPEAAGCPLSQPPFNCADQPAIQIPIFPHPTDCTRYVVCAADVAHHQQCVTGSRWDHIYQRCEVNGRCAPGTS